MTVMKERTLLKLVATIALAAGIILTLFQISQQATAWGQSDGSCTYVPIVYNADGVDSANRLPIPDDAATYFADPENCFVANEIPTPTFVPTMPTTDAVQVQNPSK